MKTREEITQLTLESIRETTISKIVTNEILLEAMRAERIKSGNENNLEVVKNIRAREANSIQFEEDLKLVESKLNEQADIK